MATVVAKFGGTSLADAGQFKKVRDIITSDTRRRYVVPSAPGKRSQSDMKVTDLLYDFHLAANCGGDWEDIYDKLYIRFTQLRDELNLKLPIEDHLEKIRKDVLNGESVDYTASRGEYLCGLILAEYLNYDFIDPKEVLFFDSSGMFESEKTKSVLRGRLYGYENAVIPGFYGSTPDGMIKTFSRGGSDITGAIVARAASANLYENWTDVEGFMMADPRIVPDAQVIPTITYRELRELSYMGASVLHEESIFPVFKARIPINIKNTNAPSLPGTMIVPDSSDLDDGHSITGIAGKKNFTVVSIEKSNMNSEIGFGRRALSAVEKNGLNWEHMPSGIDTLSIVISDTQVNDRLQKLINDIYMECEPDSIEVQHNLAIIATVGRGMIKNVGIAARLFAALAEARVNIRMIDQGSSELNIIVGVENSDFERAVEAIYRAFVS